MRTIMILLLRKRFSRTGVCDRGRPKCLDSATCRSIFVPSEASLSAVGLLAFFASPNAFAADQSRLGRLLHFLVHRHSPAKRLRADLRSQSTKLTRRVAFWRPKFELVQRDDELSPPKGLIAARELIFKEKVAAIFGGIDTPVALAVVPLVNKEKMPYMGVWAAGTGITRNGANPNYVFRVSAVDVLVDVKLLQYANQKFGSKNPVLCLSTILGASRMRRDWWPPLVSKIPTSKSLALRSLRMRTLIWSRS